MRKMTQITGMKIDTQNRTAQVVTVDTDKTSLSDFIGCRCIDIVTRMIGNHPYEVVCDDEGLFVPEPVVTAIDMNGEPMLVGSLFITGLDRDECDLCSLTESDINRIARHIRVNPYDGQHLIIGMQY